MSNQPEENLKHTKYNAQLYTNLYKNYTYNGWLSSLFHNMTDSVLASD